MTSAKKLLNSPETAVTDALEGFVLTYDHLQRLEGSPQVKVVINRHHDKSKVAVISGGGSGHEPAHVGYVGNGMLAAAVCGDVFASPSAEAVLAAIRAVTGPAGCLLVVKNYTGDRLNFGLAAEQALSGGLAVEVVVVGEDVAIAQPAPLAGRRGLAGTVLVHKAAGAAAAQGLSLSEVAAVAARVAGAMATLGVGLTTCTLPGRPTSDRLGPNEVELGLGIHGEPGRSREAPPPAARELAPRMMRSIADGPFFKLRAPPAAGAEGGGNAAGGSGAVGNAAASGSGSGRPRCALLVNNLGATTPLELAVVTREALRTVRQELRATVDRLYVGPYMTSLDMAGVSLTLLSYDADTPASAAADTSTPGGGPSWEALLRLLDAPTEAPAWQHRSGPAVPGAFDPETFADVPAPRAVHHAAPGGAAGDAARPAPGGTSPAGAALGGALRAAAEALRAAAPELDAMDAQVGDGDCGSTLAGAASALLAALGAGAFELASAAATAQQVAACVRSAVGGSSGALYDILITAAARRLKAGGSDEASPRDWAEALAAGLAAVQKYGRADRGCRTMLDALLPARDALVASLDSGADGVAAAEAAARAAEKGAESTRGMAATAGRASYVPAEVLAQVADPGAVAVAVWLRAVAQSLRRRG